MLKGLLLLFPLAFESVFLNQIIGVGWGNGFPQGVDENGAKPKKDELLFETTSLLLLEIAQGTKPSPFGINLIREVSAAPEN